MFLKMFIESAQNKPTAPQVDAPLKAQKSKKKYYAQRQFMGTLSCLTVPKTIKSYP